MGDAGKDMSDIHHEIKEGIGQQNRRGYKAQHPRPVRTFAIEPTVVPFHDRP